MTLIKSISGIRGTIGGPATENLTPLDIVKFTTAYVRFIAESAPGKRLKIVVGRDARISGEMVGDIIEGTLLGCGADVVNVGLCTTPGTELAVTAHRADGGIIITASHNPRQWNALKLLNADGEFLSDAEGKRVLALAEDENFVFPDVDHIGKVVSRESYNDEHIRRVLALPLVDAEAVRKRHFKVIVDAVNSVGGIVIPKLLRELGCEVVELNCEPTGEFAHNPEPLPENLTEISKAIVREKADLGDRIAGVFELAGAEVALEGGYDGWNPNPDSPILHTMIASYESLFGRRPVVTAIHAGLECGIIGTNYPALDMISFGPTILHPHSPDEKVNVASVGRFWQYLLATLRNVPFRS